MTTIKYSFAEVFLNIVLSIFTILAKVVLFTYIWNTFLTIAPKINYLTSYAIICLIGLCVMNLVQSSQEDSSTYRVKCSVMLFVLFVVWVCFVLLEWLFL